MIDPFNLIMLSAWHEQGGNTLLRFLDGHTSLMCYPFESQISTAHSANLLAGAGQTAAVPQRYAYPEFTTETSPEGAYHAFWDQELKTYLRTPALSKFRDCGIDMDEAGRIKSFSSNLWGLTRRDYIEAFFRSTFQSWRNRVMTGRETHCVGYSPPILLDADKFFADFPGGHMIHIVRNPWSGYADTLKRPFPMSMTRYCQVWNVCSMQAIVYRVKYAGQFHTIRYEDLIADPKGALNGLCVRLNIPPFDTDPVPSFNRQPLKEVYPWGTIRSATTAANVATAAELTSKQRDDIWVECRPMINEWSYTSFRAHLEP